MFYAVKKLKIFTYILFISDKTMNSVIKQCTINKFDLPSELCDIIKSYCFYDIKTWETIQFIRYKKELINDIFKNNVVSLANPYDVFENLDDGHWAVWVDTDEDGVKCQFQGVNCLGCGNYDEVYAPDYISRKIICDCEYDYYNDDPDHYDDDDYDSDDDASYGD
jgi:hypothetical protein